jgi:gamma-glutamyl phosphate reductase
MLAVRTVASLSAAIVHINEHGSHHINLIITASQSRLPPAARSCMALTQLAYVIQAFSGILGEVAILISQACHLVTLLM